MKKIGKCGGKNGRLMINPVVILMGTRPSCRNSQSLANRSRCIPQGFL